MCFSTGIYTRTKPKPKIAKSDITVYKDIGKYGKGYYYSLIGVDGKYMKWEKGFHYTELPDDKGRVFSFERCWNGGQWTIHKGLHSKRKRYWLSEVEMIIPKGAKYFENKTEYVSDQLIYV